MKQSLMIIMLLVLAGAASLTAAGSEGRKYMYEWTDAAGVVHITDTLGNVPEEYRSKAKKTEEGNPGESAPAPSHPAATGSAPAENSEAGKAVWQNRIKEWKNRLADAESRYRELEQERSRIYTGAYAWPGNKPRAEQIEQQMKDVAKEIAEARDMLQNVIPEEARKAGVPPGWLRE